ARQAAIDYLSRRFESDVQLGSLRIRLPNTSILRLLLTRGRGATARIEGRDLLLRLKNRPGAAPVFSIKQFHCDVSVESLFQPPVVASEIVVEGMDIQIPPRGAPPGPSHAAVTVPGPSPSPASFGAIIRKVTIQDAILVLQPRDKQRLPLRFDIQSLRLLSTGSGGPWNYQAALTNAKPPGEVHATGTFGPWTAREPGDTSITGEYHFEKADLGVFAGIAGTLDSTGSFEGQLAALTVRGQATVPNFRLRMAGNPVPLATRFTVLVDATNGNTILQPVNATLGSTNFTTSGGIIKHESNQRRAITLQVTMPDGNLRDVLRLAMKGAPFMEGRVVLHTSIDIPPLAAKVREKLEMEGRFEVLQGKFLHSTIQNQIDSLSHRASGQSHLPDTEQVVSQMKGAFHLENADMRFREVSFSIPGADIDLSGDYNLDSDALDFGGTLKLQATVSQLVTGWKGALLRPLDRFFEKDGAGTFLHIRVDGTSKQPKFGVVLAGKRLEVPMPKRKQ
ncbi:MAG TPA: hypothetical protein VME43_27245, partial [Bryobacteraceae bacterium]|nr:hypothetical protein [Bryobacteraceae bacterium]